MRAISASASRFSVAARTPRTGPQSDGPPDLGSATGPSASALSLPSKLYRGVGTDESRDRLEALVSLYISHPCTLKNHRLRWQSRSHMRITAFARLLVVTGSAHAQPATHPTSSAKTSPATGAY